MTEKSINKKFTIKEKKEKYRSVSEGIFVNNRIFNYFF